MIEEYLRHEQERAQLGISALPLVPEQVEALCGLLTSPPAGSEQFLLTLLKERVSPGVSPSAKIKALFLAEILFGEKFSPVITPVDAARILGSMLGGYNVAPLVAALRVPPLADEAATALGKITLVYDTFDEVAALVRAGNVSAARVMNSWAEAEWFTCRTALPASIKLKVFKVDGEINTDDFSPAGDAWSRPDIPPARAGHGENPFSGRFGDHCSVSQGRLPGCLCR